jgi:hypothetical protein
MEATTAFQLGPRRSVPQRGSRTVGGNRVTDQCTSPLDVGVALHLDFEPPGAVRPQRDPLVTLQLHSTPSLSTFGEADRAVDSLS